MRKWLGNIFQVVITLMEFFAQSVCYLCLIASSYAYNNAVKQGG